jgi:OOP family OmpA-OmpF porin
MVMRNGLFVLAAGCMLTVVSTAHAEESGWYVGAGFAQSWIEVNEGPFLQSDDDRMDAWSLTGGYRFNSWFAVEAGYTSLGTMRFHSDTSVPGVFDVDTKLKIEGFNAALVGTLPLGTAFDVHGRLGVLAADSDLNVSFPDNGFRRSSSVNDRAVFYGAGVAWRVNQNWSLSLDYQRYQDVGNDRDSLEADVETLGINALFKF